MKQQVVIGIDGQGSKGGATLVYLLQLMVSYFESRNIAHSVSISGDRQFGAKLENGSWNGILGDISHGSVDIAYPSLFLTESRAADFGYFPVYCCQPQIAFLFNRKVLFLKDSHPLMPWYNWPFLVPCTVWAVIGSKTSVWTSASASDVSVRYVAVALLLVMLHLSQIITSNFIFSHDLHEAKTPFSTIDEAYQAVISKKLIWVTDEMTFKGSPQDGGILRKAILDSNGTLKHTVKLTNSVEGSLEFLKNNPNAFLIYSAESLLRLAKDRPFFVLNDVSRGPATIAGFYSKNFSKNIIREIEKQLAIFCESGIWQYKYMPKREIVENERKLASDELVRSSSYSLSNFYEVWLFYSLGITIVTSAFAMEIVWNLFPTIKEKT